MKLDPNTRSALGIVRDWFESTEVDVTLNVKAARSLGGHIGKLLDALEPKEKPFDPKTDDPLGPGISQGLLIVAADALAEIRRQVAAHTNPLLIFEKVDEAIAAIVHEIEAQAEDIAWLIAQRTNPTNDPEQMGSILKRTLRRRRLR